MRSSVRGAVPASLCALTLVAGALEAQEAHLRIGATVAGARRAAREAGVVRESDGLVAGGRLAAEVGAFTLSGSYLEGDLEDGVSGVALGYVEGSAALSYRLAPWLALGTSVRVHHVAETDPERWVAWGAGARVDLPLIGRMVRGHATFFQGLGGEVNLPDGTVKSWSGEVGVTYELPRRPFQVELGTRLEEDNASGRTRTIQQLALSVDWNAW
jgi:hypothetical protein